MGAYPAPRAIGRVVSELPDFFAAAEEDAALSTITLDGISSGKVADCRRCCIFDISRLTKSITGIEGAMATGVLWAEEECQADEVQVEKLMEKAKLKKWIVEFLKKANLDVEN